MQLYSVRGDMEQDFKGTLQKVKDMGYDGVEFAAMVQGVVESSTNSRATSGGLSTN